MANSFQFAALVKEQLTTQNGTVFTPTGVNAVTVSLAALGSGSNVFSPGSAEFPGIPTPLPHAVLDLAATPGDTLVDLSWDPPDNAVYAHVTGYHITVSPADAGPFDQSDTTLEVTGLTNGTDYTFTVTAVGVSGDGPGTDVDATPSGALSIFWTRVRGSVATPWDPDSAIPNEDWRGVSILFFNGLSDDLFLALGTTLAGDGTGALALALENQRGDIWSLPAGAVPAGIWCDAVTNLNPDTGGGGDVAVMVGTTLAGVGCIARSTDGGQHWTIVTTPAGTSGYNAVTFAGGTVNRFVIVGPNGKSAISTTAAGTAFTGVNIGSSKNYNDVAWSTAFATVYAIAQGNNDSNGTIATLTSVGGGWSLGFAPPTSPQTTAWTSINEVNSATMVMVGPRSGHGEAAIDSGSGFAGLNTIGSNDYSRSTWNQFHGLVITTGSSNKNATSADGTGTWTEYDDPYGFQYVTSSFAWSIGIGGFDPDSGGPVVGIYGEEV